MPHFGFNFVRIPTDYRVWTDNVGVHIGECGCYNHTPNDIALRWFTDLFGLYGYPVDRALLDILMESRVTA